VWEGTDAAAAAYNQRVTEKFCCHGDRAHVTPVPVLSRLSATTTTTVCYFLYY